MEKFKQLSVILLVLLPLAVRSLEQSASNQLVNDAPLPGHLFGNVTNKLEIDSNQASNKVAGGGQVDSVNGSVSYANDGQPNSLPVKKLIESDHNRTATPVASEKIEKSTTENGGIKIEEKPIKAANESKPSDFLIGSSFAELNVSKPTNPQADANSSLISANSDARIVENEKPTTASPTKATSLNDRFLNESRTDGSQSNNKSHTDRSIDGITDLSDFSGNATVNLTANASQVAVTGLSANSSAIKKADNLPDAASSTIDETKLLDSRSTNEEDEFDEFEKDDTKKEDESSIIENDKASNKVEGAPEKATSKDNAGNEDERSTPKSISYKKYGETTGEMAGENEEDDESANSSNSGSSNLSNLNSNNSLRNDKNAKESNNSSTQPAAADDSEHEDDDEEELDEETTATSKKVPANQANGKRKPGVPGERERASLNKLQAFLQSSVESALKSALPELVKSGYETNLSPSCTNSFLAVSRGLQGTRQWAYKSELLLLVKVFHLSCLLNVRKANLLRRTRLNQFDFWVH